jgi:hypothetical protein
MDDPGVRDRGRPVRGDLSHHRLRSIEPHFECAIARSFVPSADGAGVKPARRAAKGATAAAWQEQNPSTSGRDLIRVGACRRRQHGRRDSLCPTQPRRGRQTGRPVSPHEGSSTPEPAVPPEPSTARCRRCSCNRGGRGDAGPRRLQTARSSDLVAVRHIAKGTRHAGCFRDAKSRRRW